MGLRETSRRFTDTGDLLDHVQSAFETSESWSEWLDWLEDVIPTFTERGYSKETVVVAIHLSRIFNQLLDTERVLYRILDKLSEEE